MINTDKLFLIAGPCAIENDQDPYHIAEQCSKVSQEFGIDYIFKASYRKANRSRLDSFQGIGDHAALEIINGVRKQFNIPSTTDIHDPTEAKMAAPYVDVLQIPAFLCRQTALLLAAAETGKVINVKKGQFVSPEAMQFAVDKVKSVNQKVWLTERGTSFGYTDLVVDIRSIPIMQEFAPVIMDCTHSLQQPNQSSGVTGGRPRLIKTIASAAVAAGCNGLFIETHPEPDRAKSDGANMLPLSELRPLLERLKNIESAIR